MSTLNNFCKVITSRTLMTIFILGIISGMPFAIFLVAITGWLKDLSVDLALITTLAAARIPYSFKWLWAPLMDRLQIPILHNLGRRRSWMIVTLGLHAIVIAWLSSVTSPGDNFSLVFMLACAAGFLAASYDIAYDAFRIELLGETEQALGAATAVFGYRVGMLSISAGALALADIYEWNLVFKGIAIVFATVVVLLILVVRESYEYNYIAAKGKAFRVVLQEYVIDPFKDILKRDYAVLILLMLVSYKAGEAMLGFLSLPFYMELGFTKTQIAAYSKLYGFFATTFGTFLGGYVLLALGNFRGLFICGLVQMITNLLFIWLHKMGNDTTALFIVICFDNIAGGMGTAALVGYLSAFCNKQYTATQYALLSSTSTFVTNTITIYGGGIVKSYGWDNFFIITVLMGLPSLVMLLWLHQKTKKN